ncbi:nuclear transport factor 2 family protein [Streptomyces caniferus]|uniref:Nuclear transport factor 2 family protein n=1 Tax=Streptomyces caniferus TaxID=285557 RepID=A0ABZ1VE53_9ACTN|nr:nuclear transport factor 2 family protein [Streptomyces caniferus]
MSQVSQATVQRVTADLYVEVQQFYARQMPLLEARKLEEFLETLTEDGSIEHRPGGWKLEGRQQLLTEMRARRGDPEQPLVEEISAREARERNVSYYDGLVYRYWFDRMHIEPVDEDTLRVRYQAIVSMTDAAGKVSFEPTTVVDDVLVRIDGELYTRSRIVTHDSPAWADKIHNPS